MIIVYPSHHVRHRPPNEIYNGNRDPHAEVPERIERIRESLQAIEGIRFILPRRFPLSWIERVHDHAYVSYLAEAGRIAGNTYQYPSVFPYRDTLRVNNEVARRGMYSFDMYTPVGGTTYQTACASAMAALTAASLVRRGERVVYALCRPPGHHAERSRMGGYCYFNNAAIAAEYLSTRGRVAVLDIDVHHGNGTQQIFYHRSDVLFISIHANPNEKFPYFSGYADERGQDQGIGYTVNYPLELHANDQKYDRVFQRSLSRIKSFTPTYLVISVGYDAHISDSIGGLGLSTSYFQKMAKIIDRLHIPTVLVQEGGYNVETIGEIAKGFVEGFTGAD